MNGTPGTIWGRMPLGLIGMLGLIWGVEHYVGSHPVEFVGNSIRLDWAMTGRGARGEDVRGSEILCFGDSQVKHGIYPRVLESTLGRPAFNLAVSAGPAPASYFLLRRALDAGARPKAVIVDFFPTLLLSDPRFTLEYWPELLSTRELVELSLVARDLRLFTGLVLAKAFPTVKDRRAIRAKVLHGLRTGSGTVPGTETYPTVLRNRRVNRGALVLPTLPTSPVAGENRPKAAKLSGPGPGPGKVWWVLNRGTTVFVRRFLDLAAARGLPVFWLVPPSSPDYQAGSERNGRDAAYAAFVRETQTRYPNVVVIDGRGAGYPPEAFFDPTHLDRNGAETFTASVASVIGPHLAGNAPSPARRWIGLPHYQARPGAFPLEDLEQSGMALRAEAGRVRR